MSRIARRASLALLVVASLATIASCAKPASPGRRTIVVTYSILGSAVKDLVGDSFDVVVLIPNGLDPHDWEPSAKDIEAVDKASLVVENGLGLEEGMQKALSGAKKSGVKVFTASDHIMARTVGESEDPHLWTDPVIMQAVVDALADEIEADFTVDLSKRRADLDGRLIALDAEIASSVAKLPAPRRVLVTGHESMGYFAQRYGFKLVGAAMPSLSSQAESSASGLSALKALIAANRVSVLFTELGENPKVAEAIAAESHAESVPLVTHALPEGGDYFAFVRLLAGTIIGALSK